MNYYLNHKKNPNLLAIIDHELRYSQILTKAKEILSEKVIGDIIQIDVNGAIVRNNSSWSWWESEEHGGGLLGASGSHWIDLLVWLSESKVTKAGGILETIHQERPEGKPVTSDDSYNLNLKVGAIPIKLASRTQPFSNTMWRMVIECTKGLLQVDIKPGENLLSVYYSDGRTLLKMAEPSPPTGIQDTMWGGGTFLLAKQLREFLVGNISLSKVIAPKFDEGHHVQTVLDAIRLSSVQGGGLVEISSLNVNN